MKGMRIANVLVSLSTLASATVVCPGQCAPQWQPAVGGGTNATVYAITYAANGDIVAGGGFVVAGGNSANHIARWNGSSWLPLGSGVDNFVSAVAELPGGDIVAGGLFATAGGTSAFRVARWNGSTWSSMGAGLNGEVATLAVTASGDLIAGGSFTASGATQLGRIAKWDGSAWVPFAAGLDSKVAALKVLPNGDILAAGSFIFAGGVLARGIARWDGATWHAFGSGLGAVGYLPSANAVESMPNGDIIAGGRFTSAGGVSCNFIARWNGTAWSALGNGLSFGAATPDVGGLAALPNGDLIAAGWFAMAGGVAANHIARWNGTTWSSVGSGFAAGTSLTLGTAIAKHPDGELLVSGGFTTSNGSPSPNLAHYVPTCAATSVVVGAACSGSGGANTYEADNLPFIGSTFRAASATVPSPAFVLVATGVQATSIPLTSLLPTALAGCELLVTPTTLDLIATTTGSVETQLPIPSNIALAGAGVLQQLVLLEVDPLLNITESTSSNALALTIGAF